MSTSIEVMHPFWLFSRAWQLLRWLLVPAFFIHVFFTPGHFMIPSWQMGPTYEGLMLAFTTVTTLTVMFFSAILFSRSLSRHEWLALPLYFPKITLEVYSLICLIGCLYPNLAKTVKIYKQRWLLQRQIRHAPLLLSATFLAAIHTGRLQTQQLWLRWQSHPITTTHQPLAGRDIIWITGSCLWFLLVLWS
ncbi:MAG: hypothetical protein R8M38_07875 [Mariprofundaceae bacterium]